MKRTRYTMPARSQGKLYTQRQLGRLIEKRRSQVMYIPHFTSPTQARTHIVLNNAPPLHAMAENDEAKRVDARGLTPRDAVKALIKATGLSPHLMVCGWPFCLDDLEGGAM